MRVSCGKMRLAPFGPLAGKARIALLPGGPHSRMLANLLAAESGAQEAAGQEK